MISSLVALAVIAFSPMEAQNLQVSVNVKDGDTISGEMNFRVSVQSKNPVNQVEFYVGDNLRDTDSSTPYEFKLDTISENDGSIKLTFAAYTTEGENVKRVVNAKIDNGLSKGADFHVTRGRELLSESKWDDAILAGRIALKAKPNHNPARLIMARAYYGLGVLDKAQKYAEDALSDDPKFSEAQEFLSAILLNQVFTIINRGGKEEETIKAIRTTLVGAVTNSRKFVDAGVDNFGTVTAENRMAYVDAAIRAHRYSAVTQELGPIFRQNSKDYQVGNRLAYAYVRLGRWDEAFIAMEAMKRAGVLDAYSYALLGVIEAWRSNEQASDDAMREAVLSDGDNLGVRTAQAAIALRRGRYDTLGPLSTALVNDAGSRTESFYYRSIAQNARSQFADAERSFQRAVLADPINYEMYIERGNQALTLVINSQVSSNQFPHLVQLARAYFEASLAARPDSAEALTGIAFVSAYEKKNADAIRFARAATQANANYAAGHFLLSMVAATGEAEAKAAAENIRRGTRDGSLTSEQREQIRRLSDQSNEYGKEAVRANQEAGRLDRANLSGRTMPGTIEAFNYFVRYGRIPYMISPK
ncbi:MAG: hypothetical protein KF784_13935 [Fimbriimonadaceae bacterium]|nr:hypothetical protein [Fimbriimonadaceae bacterium]